MTDQLEEIFASVRAETLREIRAPGPAAAHLIVRRRRRAKMMAAAVAVLAAAGISALVVPRGSAVAPWPAAAPSAPGDVALAKLRSLSPQPAVEGQSRVVTGFQISTLVYTQTLALQIACVGTGTITLAVAGEPLENPGDPTQPTKLGKIAATCSTDPHPVSAVFHVRFTATKQLTISMDAYTGQGSFAYRLTGPADLPYAPDSLNADPSQQFQHVFQPPGLEAMNFYPASTTFTELAAWSAMADAASYTLAVICGGSGTATVEIRSEGEPVTTDTVTCAWPAARHNVDVGHLGKNGSIRLRYTYAPPKSTYPSAITSPAQEAPIATALLERR